MTKAPLCCVVNPEGVCRKCREKKCDTHSFKCAQCKRVCYDCRRQEECSNCTATICNKCAMVSREKTIVCALCYDVKMGEFDMEDALGLIEYNEDR